MDCVFPLRAWEPLDQAVADCVFPSRAWELLDQANDSLRLANQEQERGSCVSLESLGAVGSSSCRLCVSFYNSKSSDSKS